MVEHDDVERDAFPLIDDRLLEHAEGGLLKADIFAVLAVRLRIGDQIDLFVRALTDGRPS